MSLLCYTRYVTRDNFSRISQRDVITKQVVYLSVCLLNIEFLTKLRRECSKIIALTRLNYCHRKAQLTGADPGFSEGGFGKTPTYNT